MATFSVFNQQTKAYDYYDAPTPVSDAPPTPGHLRPKDLGVAVTTAGWPLPAGAKWVGRGDTARGQVATPMGDDGASSSTSMLSILALAAAAFLIWRNR